MRKKACSIGQCLPSAYLVVQWAVRGNEGKTRVTLNRDGHLGGGEVWSISKRLLEHQPYFVASSVGDWRKSVHVSNHSRPHRIAG
jgi:hypothetical protein